VNGRLMTDWRRSRNSLDQFVHEGCRLEPELKVKRSDFYNAYKEWCLEVGKKPFAKSKVKDLLEHGIGYGIIHSRPNGIETFNGVDVNEEEFEPLFG
jgi:putative DNA primase/helicase